MSSNLEVQQFWANIEEQIGEAVRVFSLGELKNSFNGLPASTVGMFFVTDSAFYFHVLPKQSWFDAVLKNVKSRKRQEESLFFVVPLSSIGSVSMKRKQSLFARLLTSRLTSMTILYQNVHKEEESLSFSLISETAADEMLSSIKKRKATAEE